MCSLMKKKIDLLSKNNSYNLKLARNFKIKKTVARIIKRIKYGPKKSVCKERKTNPTLFFIFIFGIYGANITKIQCVTDLSILCFTIETCCFFAL